MKLTAEQTEDLPFPVGCPVWYGFQEGNKGGSEPLLLKEGVVGSVSFDVISKDMVYEIIYDGEGGKVVDEISEKQLAYAANCPVTIDPNGESSADGTILLCEPSNEEPSKFLYTAMILTEGCRARYESGIERKRLKFRRVEKDAKLAAVEAVPSPPKAIIAQKEQPVAAVDAPSAKPAAPSLVEDEIVPSSITCDSVAKSSHSKEGGSKRRMSGGSSQVSDTAKKPRTEATANPADTRPGHDPMMMIRVPLWLQRDSQMQQNLFRHLVPSKRHAKKRGVNDIGRETNCGIFVKFDARDHAHPMTIRVNAKGPSTQTNTSFSERHANARKEITDLLMKYMDIKRDGAKGRLVYDIAVQCAGGHRPNNSTSRAVQVKNPFDVDGKGLYASVLELPYEVYKGRKEYHASYLRDRRFLDDLQHKHCRIIVCGDDFGTPTRCCDPYVFLMGRRWQDVDWAADAVKGEIRRHMDKCVCRLR